MINCNPIHIPIESKSILTSASATDDLADATLYQKMVGSIMYMVTMTRPDLLLAITFLSQLTPNLPFNISEQSKGFLDTLGPPWTNFFFTLGINP